MRCHSPWVGLLWAAAWALCGCRGPEASEPPVRPVRAIRAGDLKAVVGREFPGRAQAKDDVELSFQVAGPLVSLPVDVGRQVKKGEPIASIDPRDYQAAVDNARATLERSKANLLAMERGARPEELEQLKAAVAEAEATFNQAAGEHERVAELYRMDAVSQRDFDVSLARRDRSAAQVKSAKEALNIGIAGARPEDLEAKRAEIQALEAALASAQNQLDYTVLTAPFDGEVAARYVDNFQTVQAKQPIVRLVDVSKIEITVQIPENLISLVPQVTKAVCKFDAIVGQEFEGQVTKIGSEASQTTRTYPVTVEVAQPEGVKILPGMSAVVRGKADPSAGDDQPLVIPAGAIQADETGQQSQVWVVDEKSGKVSRRKVKTGKLTAVGVQITSGLKPGEWVITAGVQSLREDQTVKILKEEN